MVQPRPHGVVAMTSIYARRQPLLRWRSTLLSGIVVIALAALNVEPANANFGFALAGVAAVAAALDPVAYFAFVAGSQVAIDPAGSPVTIMQMGVAAWALALPWSGWLRGRRTAVSYVRAAAPLLLWVLFVQTLNGTVSLLGSDLLLAVMAGAVLAGYAASYAGPLNHLVGALVGGMAIACLGYWGSRFGLPVAVVEIADSVRGVTRIGVGRGDVNNAGVNLPLALWGTVALAVAASMTERARALFRLVIVPLSVAILVPAILATGSRTSLYQVVAGVAAILVLWAAAFRLRRARRPILMTVALTAAMLPVLTETQIGEGAMEYLAATIRANREQAASSGGETFAGRQNAWGTHIAIVAEYPVTGIPAGTVWDFGEYGGAEVGRSGTFGRAHNTILEYASLAGLPAALLFLWTALKPAWRSRHLLGCPSAHATLVLYATALVGMLGLSIPAWKTYWALLALMQLLPRDVTAHSAPKSIEGMP
jgi:O-antigen ligase